MPRQSKRSRAKARPSPARPKRSRPAVSTVASPEGPRLAEALAQQEATSEILRVISWSPGDAQPVFEAIVRSATRLCDAEFSAVARFEGGLLHLAAISGKALSRTMSASMPTFSDCRRDRR